MKKISCFGLLCAAILFAGCREDPGGGDDDHDGEGGGSSKSSGYVCVMMVHSGYWCSDGDTYTAPTELFCRDDFGSLDECRGTMVGQTDYADGCTFETTFSDFEWLKGPCSKHYEDPPEPETCDGSGSCESCAQCAAEGDCAGPLATCQGNSECIGLSECLSGCASGDSDCVDGCAGYYSGGVDDFLSYLSCVVCSSCYSDCDGASQCE